MRRLLLAVLLALMALPASAVPPPVREPMLPVPPRPSGLFGFDGAGPYRLYDDWLVVCDNLASCVALAAVPEGTAILRIARSGNWDALPDLVADLSFAGIDQQVVQLVLQPAASRPHGTTGRRARTRLRMIRIAAGWYGLTGADTAAFLAAARTADHVEFVAGEERVAGRVSLRGLVAAMNRIDHVQTRTGTITGTYSRGGILVPLAAIMPPPAPLVQPRSGVRDPQDHTTGTRAFRMVCGTGVQRSAGDAAVFLMDTGHRIVAVDCGVEGLNGGRIWLVADQAGNLDLAGFPTPDLHGPDTIAGFLPNSWFEHFTGRLYSIELGRQAGDCGSRLVWQWTAEGFRLAEGYRMPLCTGTAQLHWPRTWATRQPD